MVNYADEAARHFDLERQEQVKFTQRTAFLKKQAQRELNRRIRYYPRYYQDRYGWLLELLHADMCKEDLIRQEIIANQNYYRSRAHAFSAEAVRLGHVGTGVYA